jgi:hypothetical protein
LQHELSVISSHSQASSFEELNRLISVMLPPQKCILAFTLVVSVK